jgi:hypothetical protein
LTRHSPHLHKQNPLSHFHLHHTKSNLFYTKLDPSSSSP